MKVLCCTLIPLPVHDSPGDAAEELSRLVEEVVNTGHAVLDPARIGRPQGLRLFGDNLPKDGLRPCAIERAVVTKVNDGSASLQHGGFCYLANVVVEITASNVIFTDDDVMTLLRGYMPRVAKFGRQSRGLRAAINSDIEELLETPHNLTVEAIAKIRRLSTRLPSGSLRDAATLVCDAIDSYNAKKAKSRAELFASGSPKTEVSA